MRNLLLRLCDVAYYPCGLFMNTTLYDGRSARVQGMPVSVLPMTASILAPSQDLAWHYRKLMCHVEFSLSS